MSVISISVIESPMQVVAGVPSSITVNTNIPATIFYTLDGTTPDTSSMVIVGPLKLTPTSKTITLKLFATDGINSSAIVELNYGPNIFDARKPMTKVSGINSPSKIFTNPPFSSSDLDGIPTYSSQTDWVATKTPTAYPDGYDGTATGTPATYTVNPLTDYKMIFSKTDAQGRMGRNIGNLPSHITIVPKKTEKLSSSSKVNDLFFDPKAYIIYYDDTAPNENSDMNIVFRPFFSLKNQTGNKDANNFFTTGFEGNGFTGSALKPQYNPRDNTLTYYYRDSDSNRWIISKVAYQPGAAPLNLSYIPMSRERNTFGFVFEWLPFRYRRLI